MYRNNSPASVRVKTAGLTTPASQLAFWLGRPAKMLLWAAWKLWKWTPEAERRAMRVNGVPAGMVSVLRAVAGDAETAAMKRAAMVRILEAIVIGLFGLVSWLGW